MKAQHTSETQDLALNTKAVLILCVISTVAKEQKRKQICYGFHNQNFFVEFVTAQWKVPCAKDYGEILDTSGEVKPLPIFCYCY